MSSPRNLDEITPKWMNFEITSKNTNQNMYPGMIITYNVTPFLNLKMVWITEITHIEDHILFIDEQRIGPYKMWHHEHRFEQVDDGILMTDTITYVPPFGLFGILVNHLFIKNRITNIFDYRKNILEKIFN
jgi:ligand-binding SRPBCC domain-containing protein